ncbi:MAG: hypothetical protein C5B50_14955 [Verrucomicrobia bacterium]|nr:MAG: hypothetical protein C5B50_14955 [Verrucomicrobiota bacterium]
MFALDPAVSAPQVNFQHLTTDECLRFLFSPSGPRGTWTALNSLYVNTGDRSTIPSTLQTSPNQTISSPISIFQYGGDSSHYLPPGSLYKARGSMVGLDATLLGELANKTTSAPMDIPWFYQMNGTMTLSTNVPRYVPGTAPDLGFYFDVLDYTVSYFSVGDGGQLNVLPGTAIGFRYDLPFGFVLQQGASFSSQGMPARPITFAPVSSVQEGPFPYFWMFPDFLISFVPHYWPEVLADPSIDPDLNPEGSPPPSLDFRFCNFYLPAGSISHHFWGGMAPWYLAKYLQQSSVSSVMSLQMRDCAIHSGWINLGEPHGQVIPPVFQPGWPTNFQRFCGPPIPGQVSLFNNVFDRVFINLDADTGPTWWSGPYTDPTIDLQLTATNNTFRGGWLSVEPINASVGNWVFENNLFDQTIFAQDQYQPLDYDWNAYWAAAAGDVGTGQSTHLIPHNPNPDGYIDGQHEVTLSAAPVFTNGPLGNFYLDTTQAPWGQLHGAGWGSPADVGLYHFTSRADQVKEGDELATDNTHHANIGAHYVAVNTTGQSAGQPKDYDGDGIPDYVENWHGDGVWAQGSETDWHATAADGASHPGSPTYDDIDLSGDGLVGRIKRALEVGPFDRGNPLILIQKTVGSDGNIAHFELPLNYNAVTAAGNLTVYVDGVNATMQECTEAENGNSLLGWNTTFDAPGPHLLQVEFSLSGLASETAVHYSYGTIVPFTSQNVIQFFESGFMYDANGAYLDAKVVSSNVRYTIDLYDPSTVPPTLVRKIGPNSTQNGTIQENWNVTYSDNITPYIGNTVNAVFNATLYDPAGAPAGSGSATKALFLSPDGVPTEIGKKFDFCYMCIPKPADPLGVEFSRGGDIWEKMQDAVDILIAPDYLWEPYLSDLNGFAPPTTAEYPGYLASRDDVRSKLIPSNGMASLRDAKQFYCAAHGSTYSLGAATGDAELYCVEVSNFLGNDYVNILGRQNHHPYRFVFLDGCSTAKEETWCRAFGIYPKGSPDEPRRDNLGPQAFVGWGEDVQRGLAGLTNTSYYADAFWLATEAADTTGTFYLLWMSGIPLAQCITWTSDPKFVTVPLPVRNRPNKHFKYIDVTNPQTEGVMELHTAPLYVVGHSGLRVDGWSRELDNLYRPPYQRR